MLPTVKNFRVCGRSWASTAKSLICIFQAGVHCLTCACNTDQYFHGTIQWFYNMRIASRKFFYADGESLKYQAQAQRLEQHNHCNINR